MQLEWSRFLEGITSFKTGQGMLWMFCGAVFIYSIRKRIMKNSAFWVAGLLL